jgi:FMN phosphatase YigB (HAD superfamily)
VIPKVLMGMFRIAVSISDPHEGVYVGDDWRIDICGSQAVGMHPVWLQHRLVKRHWPLVETTVPVINGLERLLDIEDLILIGSQYAQR